MSTRSCSPTARRGTGSSELVKRRRRLTGAEVDELVDLYQRVSTHLSMVRSASSGLGAGRPAVGAGRQGPVGGHRCPRTAVERVRPVLDGVLPGRRLPVPGGGGWLRRWPSSSSPSSSRCGWRATPRCRRPSGPPVRSTNWSTTTSPTTTASTRRHRSRCRCGSTTPGWPRSASAFAILLGIPIPYRAVPERRQPRGDRRA